MPIIEIERKTPDRSSQIQASFTLNKSGAKINLFKTSLLRLIESELPIEETRSLRLFFDTLSKNIFLQLDTDGEFPLQFRNGAAFIHVSELKPHIPVPTKYKLLTKDQLSSLPDDLLFSKKFDFALVPISNPKTLKKIKAAS